MRSGAAVILAGVVLGGLAFLLLGNFLSVSTKLSSGGVADIDSLDWPEDFPRSPANPETSCVFCD